MSSADNPENLAPEAPRELKSAMQEAVGGVANPSAEQMLRAADRLLAKVLETNCESRASALDLLTVDALVTQAMESAADDPSLLQRLSDIAMQTIAAHADPAIPRG